MASEIPSCCELCGIGQFSSPASATDHFSSLAHSEQYLLTEQAQTFPVFAQQFSHVPFLLKEVDEHLQENKYNKDDPLDTHVYRTMVVKKNRCTMCGVDVRGGYNNWKLHMGGRKHSMAFIKEMDDLGGIDNYRTKYGCLPIPPPDKILQFTRKVERQKQSSQPETNTASGVNPSNNNPYYDSTKGGQSIPAFQTSTAKASGVNPSNNNPFYEPTKGGQTMPAFQTSTVKGEYVPQMDFNQHRAVQHNQLDKSKQRNYRTSNKEPQGMDEVPSLLGMNVGGTAAAGATNQSRATNQSYAADQSHVSRAPTTSGNRQQSWSARGTGGHEDHYYDEEDVELYGMAQQAMLDEAAVKPAVSMEQASQVASAATRFLAQQNQEADPGSHYQSSSIPGLDLVLSSASDMPISSSTRGGSNLASNSVVRDYGHSKNGGGGSGVGMTGGGGGSIWNEETTDYDRVAALREQLVRERRGPGSLPPRSGMDGLPMGPRLMDSRSRLAEYDRLTSRGPSSYDRDYSDRLGPRSSLPSGMLSREEEVQIMEVERDRLQRQARLRAVKAEKEKLMLELEEQRELAEKQKLLQELEEQKKQNREFKKQKLNELEDLMRKKKEEEERKHQQESERRLAEEKQRYEEEIQQLRDAQKKELEEQQKILHEIQERKKVMEEEADLEVQLKSIMKKQSHGAAQMIEHWLNKLKNMRDKVNQQQKVQQDLSDSGRPSQDVDAQRHLVRETTKQLRLTMESTRKSTEKLLKEDKHTRHRDQDKRWDEERKAREKALQSLTRSKEQATIDSSLANRKMKIAAEVDSALDLFDEAISFDKPASAPSTPPTKTEKPVEYETKEVLSQSETRLVLRNIRPDINNEYFLKMHFQKFGPVLKVECNVSQGGAAVQFKYHEHANVAKEKGAVVAKGMNPLQIYWELVSKTVTVVKENKDGKSQQDDKQKPPPGSPSKYDPAIPTTDKTFDTSSAKSASSSSHKSDKNTKGKGDKVPDSSFCEVCSDILPNEKERRGHYTQIFTYGDGNKQSPHAKNYLKTQMIMGLSGFYERFKDVKIQVIDSRVTMEPGMFPSHPSPFSREQGYDQFVWRVGVVGQFYCSICKLKTPPDEDKVRSWFTHVHRRKHVETYIEMRKDQNIQQLIENFGIFVIPTMPLVETITSENMSFRNTFSGLPWDRYLGNWFSTPTTMMPPATLPPPMMYPGPPMGPMPGFPPGMYPGPHAGMHGPMPGGPPPMGGPPYPGIGGPPGMGPPGSSHAPPSDRPSSPMSVVSSEDPSVDPPPPGEENLKDSSESDNMNTTIHIVGLNPKATDDDLIDLVKQFGPRRRTWRAVDSVTGRCKGHGFVEFEKASHAALALKHLHRRAFYYKGDDVGPRKRSPSPDRRHHRSSSLERKRDQKDGRDDRTKKSGKEYEEKRRKEDEERRQKDEESNRDRDYRWNDRNRSSPSRRGEGRRRSRSRSKDRNRRRSRSSSRDRRSRRSRSRGRRSDAKRSRSRSPSSRSSRKSSPKRSSPKRSSPRRSSPSRSSGQSRSKDRKDQTSSTSSKGKEDTRKRSSKEKEAVKKESSSSTEKDKKEQPLGLDSSADFWGTKPRPSTQEVGDAKRRKMEENPQDKFSFKVKQITQPKPLHPKVVLTDRSEEDEKSKKQTSEDNKDTRKVEYKIGVAPKTSSAPSVSSNVSSKSDSETFRKPMHIPPPQRAPISEKMKQDLQQAKNRQEKLLVKPTQQHPQRFPRPPPPRPPMGTSGRDLGGPIQYPPIGGMRMPPPRAALPPPRVHVPMAPRQQRPQKLPQPFSHMPQTVPSKREMFNGTALPEGVTIKMLEDATDSFCKNLYQFLEILFGDENKNLPMRKLSVLEPAEQTIALQLQKGLQDPKSLNRIINGIQTLNTLPTNVVQLLGSVDPSIVSLIADKRGFRLADMTPGQLLGQFMSGNMDKDTLHAIKLDFKVKRQLEMIRYMKSSR